MRHTKAAVVVTGCLLAVGFAVPAVAAPQIAQTSSRSSADDGAVQVTQLPQVADGCSAAQLPQIAD